MAYSSNVISFVPNKVDTPPAICSYAPYAAVALLASAATPVAAAAVPAVNAFPISVPADIAPFATPPSLFKFPFNLDIPFSAPD